MEIGEHARANKCTWQICMLHANRALADKRAGRLDDALRQFAIVRNPLWPAWSCLVLLRLLEFLTSLAKAQEGFRTAEDATKEGMCAFQRGLIEGLRRRPGEARDHCEDVSNPPRLIGCIGDSDGGVLDTGYRNL